MIDKEKLLKFLANVKVESEKRKITGFNDPTSAFVHQVTVALLGQIEIAVKDGRLDWSSPLSGGNKNGHH